MSILPKPVPPTYRIAPRGEQPIAVVRPPRRAAIFIPAIVSFVLGGGLFFLGPFEYPGRASFRIGRTPSGDIPPIDSTTSQINIVQRELAAFMSENHAIAASPNGLLRWQIDAADANSLELRVIYSAAAHANARLREVSDSYLAQLKEVGRVRRTMPSQAEQILGEYVGQLETRVASATKLADEAEAALLIADPRVDRKALLEKWRNLRGDLQVRRDELRNTTAELDRHRIESIPVSGIVNSEDRKTAIESDAALTEDLRELTVRFTEVKRFIQKVNEDSREPLDATGTAADQLTSALSSADRAKLDRTTGEVLDKLQQDAAGFVSALATFADAWRGAFRSVDQTSIDNQSASLFDQHLRLEILLSSMLFDSGKRLTTMRTQIGAIEQSPTDDARHHVLISEITHGFQAMQSSFHRFEFAAGAIDSRNNFRLDAALRSARGLHRRTQEAISQIDKALAKQAGERAKKEHELATVRAEEHLARLRAASEQSVDLLLTAQDGINTADNVNENLARAALRAELAAAHARSAQEDLDRARSQLQALTTQRMSSDISEGITLASCAVDSRPSNLLDRAWTSALAAMCVFITLLVVQLWTTRT
ncbi:MAG: hypothetical protein HY287_09165 [Planctomycetes bacterium]|nr:hypothetical protein [Planctomycetota bacterium]MBI3834480.1 hypothetical protein [Planctomycetota bacterium]